MLGEGGCAPPLQIQIWPACDRSLQDYYFNSTDGHPVVEYELTSVRGVPAARFADGMMEIYTGNVTVVVFADEEALRREAIENLRGANALAGGISPGENLPAPVAGAMSGELTCRSTGAA